MGIILKHLIVGAMQVNCYIVGCPDTKAAMIIDPGDDFQQIVSVVEAEGLKPEYILLTHIHYDHIMAVEQLRARYPAAKLVISKAAVPALADSELNLSAFLGTKVELAPADKLLEDGQQLDLGQLSFSVLATPGHTKGSICLLGPGMVFSGDTLFCESVGRSDFPGGDAAELMRSIKSKLRGLAGETVLYPGHMASSTIAHELQHNPFLR